MQAIVELNDNLGLPIKINREDFSLIFADESLKVKPVIRTIKEMREVLWDKSVDDPKQLYYMYRDIALTEDRKTIKENELRFDITVIRPERLGKEYMKTAGHYHQDSFPELYEVVLGEAWCLLQRKSDDYRKIIDVILLKAKQGDKIVCLPDYGHILINPSKDNVLVTANWVSSRFSSEYTLYKEAGGAAYFFLNVDSQTKIVKNNTFKELPKIRTMRPSAEIDKFGLQAGRPIYHLIKRDVKKLEFLNYPKEFDYDDVFVKY